MKMKVRGILPCLFFLLSHTVLASQNENELAVHLLSYLAQDYGEAVENGKIKSKEEYQEQRDFSDEIIRIASENRYDDELKKSILNLNKGILEKENVKVISSMANAIKSDILRKFNLVTYPEKSIDLARADHLYRENCMTCHGQNGHGDGDAGKGLDPSPTNFHDLERMQNVSPYGAFNTITLGVNGTGMVPHDYLATEDRWSLAYYITSFRFQNVKKIEGMSLDVSDSSALSDNEIKERYGLDDEESLGVLAVIRDTKSKPQSGGKKNQLELHITRAINDLNESMSLYISGRVSEAKNLSLTAYLQGIEPIEGILKANNGALVFEIESALSKYRSLLNKNASKEELATVLGAVVSKLEDVVRSTRDKKTDTSSFWMAFGIVLREAFEAGLVIFLLLSLTRKSNATAFNKHVHAGWISSLFIGIILYFIVDRITNVSGRVAESLEGYTALVASGLLFYVGYWLHKNADLKKMKEHLTSAVDNSLRSGKGIAIFLIAFTAAFREIFETLLFLKILILDGHHRLYVGMGAVLAIALTIVIIMVSVGYSIKLNLKYLFKASTVLILSLSTIFLGKGIGALQKAGSFIQTSVDGYSIPSLGFNSTLEVLIAQVAMIMTILTYIFLSNYRAKKTIQ